MANVDNKVEKLRKTMLESLENFVKNCPNSLLNVYKIYIHKLSQFFPTDFSTGYLPLFLINFFHYSTYPTTTTTKYIK